MTPKDHLVNVIFAIDCALLSICTLGESYPSESISSAAYRAEKFGYRFAFARPIIDWLACPLQKDHCKWAYDNAKLNLPEDER